MKKFEVCLDSGRMDDYNYEEIKANSHDDAFDKAWDKWGDDVLWVAEIGQRGGV